MNMFCARTLWTRDRPTIAGSGVACWLFNSWYVYVLPGHFADRHFAERHIADGQFADSHDISPTGHFADKQFADRDYFDRDWIKAHIFKLATFFKFLFLPGTWFYLKPGIFRIDSKVMFCLPAMCNNYIRSENKHA